MPTGSILMTHLRDSTVLKIKILRPLMTQTLLMLQRIFQELETITSHSITLSSPQRVIMMDSSTRISKATMLRRVEEFKRNITTRDILTTSTFNSIIKMTLMTSLRIRTLDLLREVRLPMSKLSIITTMTKTILTSICQSQT